MRSITKLSVLSVVIILSAMLFSCGARVANKSTSNDDKNAQDAVSKVNTVDKIDVSDTKGVKVLIKTTVGNMTVLLYDETALHKANFIKLVKEKFYDGVLFHRVIKEFMIQTGDPDSKNASKNQMLGSGGPGYTIAAEFKPQFIHKKGALAAARQGDNVNPEKKSSGSQFYIVQGKKYSDAELKQLQEGMAAQKYTKHLEELHFWIEITLFLAK